MAKDHTKLIVAGLFLIVLIGVLTYLIPEVWKAFVPEFGVVITLFLILFILGTVIKELQIWAQ